MQIGVIGSINVDLVYSLDKSLILGETVTAKGYDIYSGGKGANQAVALKALHENTIFLGAVGKDTFGIKAKEDLANKNLSKNVFVSSEPTGLAIVQLFNKDNQIVLFPGSNHTFNEKQITDFFNSNPMLKVIVLQFEINQDAVIFALKEAKKRNIITILNPAPAPQIFNLDWLQFVDYLIPNEHELASIFKKVSLEKSLTKYSEKLIVTLGGKGVSYSNGSEIINIPALDINVIDTTGAGDSFIAGFAYGIANDKSVEECIKYGIQIASITCQIIGAQTAYQEIKKINLTTKEM